MNNTVELIGFYGGDESHALSAWTSTGHVISPERRERIGALLAMLARSEPPHSTPFEKSLLHFVVRCETASHIHLLKHRIGVSLNGESPRYKELSQPTCYMPDDWPEEVRKIIAPMYENLQAVYHDLIAALEPTLGRKRAKESARFVLPYANQLTLDVSFNFRSFVHFLKLRHHPDAQREINAIAEQMLELTRETGAFTLSLEAFRL